MMTRADNWFSDEALRKQKLFDDLKARGLEVPLGVLCGIGEPRVPPTEAECCSCCGLDARDETGGLTHADGKAFCCICVGRGHDED